MPTTTHDTTASLRLPATLKERLDETGNLNAYLREAAERRLKKYREAKEYLYADGWKKNEIRAIVDAVKGHHFSFGFDVRGDLSAAMEGWTGYPEWGISEDEWSQLVSDVQMDEPSARALKTLAEEARSEASEHVEL